MASPSQIHRIDFTKAHVMREMFFIKHCVTLRKQKDLCHYLHRNLGDSSHPSRAMPTEASKTSQAKTQSNVIMMIIYMQLSLEYTRKLLSFTPRNTPNKKISKNSSGKSDHY